MNGPVNDSPSKIEKYREENNNNWSNEENVRSTNERFKSGYVSQERVE